MRELKGYISNKNMWCNLTNSRPIPMPELMTYDDIRKVAGMVEYDLSPENLTQDGELAGDRLHDKQMWLTQVRFQLDSLR